MDLKGKDYIETSDWSNEELEELLKVAGELKEKFKNVRIALGAVAPTVIRATKTEKLLNSSDKTELIMKKAGKVASTECSPISDVRGSKKYRRLMVEKLLNELLRSAP